MSISQRSKLSMNKLRSTIRTVERRSPAPPLFPLGTHQDLLMWLRSFEERKEKPTEVQRLFLERLIQRLQLEAEAEQKQSANNLQEEPMFDMIHGVPGAGKRKLIAWIREAFEKVLGWTHGVQFVCLAFQNAMVAHIEGYTVHHWTGMPVAETEGYSTTRDNRKFPTQCQSLRFLLIDEISMVSAQLFDQPEVLMAKVVRVRSGYKQRADGTIRPFGGANVLLFGDWWQLKPVTGTALFTNPSEAPSFVALHGLQLFWGRTWGCRAPVLGHACFHALRSPLVQCVSAAVSEWTPVRGCV